MRARNQSAKEVGFLQGKRNEIWEKYSVAFSKIDSIKTPVKRNYVDPTWHLYPIRVPSEIRERVVINLRNQGIGVQVNYIPANWHPAFANLSPNIEAALSLKISIDVKFHYRFLPA